MLVDFQLVHYININMKQNLMMRKILAHWVEHSFESYRLELSPKIVAICVKIIKVKSFRKLLFYVKLKKVWSYFNQKPTNSMSQ